MPVEFHYMTSSIHFLLFHSTIQHPNTEHGYCFSQCLCCKKSLMSPIYVTTSYQLRLYGYYSRILIVIKTLWMQRNHYRYFASSFQHFMVQLYTCLWMVTLNVQCATCTEKRYMTIKVHQLLHLVECVRHLGPLWAHSCFPFESFNGRIKRMFHGTRNPHLQVRIYIYIYMYA